MLMVPSYSKVQFTIGAGIYLPRWLRRRVLPRSQEQRHPAHQRDYQNQPQHKQQHRYNTQHTCFWLFSTGHCRCCRRGWGCRRQQRYRRAGRVALLDKHRKQPRLHKRNIRRVGLQSEFCSRGHQLFGTVCTSCTLRCVATAPPRLCPPPRLLHYEGGILWGCDAPPQTIAGQLPF